MTKNQEFTGWIVSKEQKKVYDKKSEWYGNLLFRITVVQEINQQRLVLFVYSNLVSSSIFQTIEQSQYVDKRYLFFCEKRKRGLILHNWQVATTNHDQKT